MSNLLATSRLFPGAKRSRGKRTRSNMLVVVEELDQGRFCLRLQLSALLFCLQRANTQGRYDVLAPAQGAQNLPSQHYLHPRNQNLTMEETAVQVVTR